MRSLFLKCIHLLLLSINPYSTSMIEGVPNCMFPAHLVILVLMYRELACQERGRLLSWTVGRRCGRVKDGIGDIITPSARYKFGLSGRNFTQID